MNWIVAPLVAASMGLAIGSSMPGAKAQPAGGGGVAPVGTTTPAIAPPTAPIQDTSAPPTTPPVNDPIVQTDLTIGKPPNTQDITIVEHKCKNPKTGKDVASYLGFDQTTGAMVGEFTKRPPSDPKSAFSPWKGPTPVAGPCPPKTLVMVIPKKPPATTGGVKIRPNWMFSGGLGGTVLVPNVKFDYLGTGVGPGASQTLSPARVMPTLEFDARHPIGNGMAIGASGNFMLPISGASTKNVTANVPGTLSYTQGLAANAFVNWLYEFCDWAAASEEDYYDCLDWADYQAPIRVRFILGAGFALDQWKASEVFPGNGDNFSTGWQTNIEPSFQAGVSLKSPYLGGGWTQLLVTDTLGGGTKTMPGGNAASFGTAKFGNNVGVTLKYVLPFGDP
ncbi:MAG: hypothetical protein KGL11_02250 [Alphaproteobacteria bacterium]|nr:hypothetical protein [Alphaproteobacteria bacterium]